MSHTITGTSFYNEQRRISGTHPIDMYVLNASPTGYDPLYYANFNQNVYGWELNGTTNSIKSIATLYTAAPIKRTNAETNIEGTLTDLTITIPNVDRTIEAIIQSKNYLRGLGITVITTFGKYLPQGSTAYHIGTAQDHNALIKERAYVDSVTSNESEVSIICRTKFDIKNIVLPRRRFTKECFWYQMDGYLGSYCDPLGSINNASYPSCDGTLQHCEVRGNSRRFGGFPSIPDKGYIVL
jgi:lambda family phage minor tail protein L